MVSRVIGLVAVAGVIAGGAGFAKSTSPTHWTAAMTAGSETPPNDSKATGTATFTLNGTKVQFKLTAKGLSGTATAAHIHVGAVGVAGPPVYTFVMLTNNGTGTMSEGVIDLSSSTLPGVSGDSLKTLLMKGDTYVNLHTAAFPKGEIRGQLKGN